MFVFTAAATHTVASVIPTAHTVVSTFPCFFNSTALIVALPCVAALVVRVLFGHQCFPNHVGQMSPFEVGRCSTHYGNINGRKMPKLTIVNDFFFRTMVVQLMNVNRQRCCGVWPYDGFGVVVIQTDFLEATVLVWFLCGRDKGSGIKLLSLLFGKFQMGRFVLFGRRFVPHLQKVVGKERGFHVHEGKCVGIGGRGRAAAA